jgi:hypothetical protein
MKPIQILSTLALSAAALAFVGCASKPPKVNTEFDSDAPFTEARTFAILPLPKDIPGADPGLAMRVGDQVLETVRTAMTAKGYTETAKEDADIAVLIHGKLVPKTNVTDWGFTPYYGAYGWNRSYRSYYGGYYSTSNVTVDQYDEGTLIGEVYAVDSKSMIWVGWITDRANTKREGEVERITNAVNRLLAQYPPMGAMPVGDVMDDE